MSSTKCLAYRFALRDPKGSQQAQLRRYAGQLRWIWNKALHEQRRRHAAGEKYAGYAAMCKWLTAWRNDPATAWLAQAPTHPQQQVLRRLDEAYKRFFVQQGGFPKFCRRGEEPGIRFPDPKQFALDQGNGRIKLPKLGWMRLRQSRPVEGTLKNVSLRREGQRWFCSIQVEQPETLPAAGVKPTLGIDLGLTLFPATSDGQEISPLKALECQQRRLRRYQKAVSRKKKGSANRRKAVDRLARLHRRIAHQRLDWLHQLTTELADRHPVIAIEDLKILNMAASAAGTVKNPGKNVKAKSGLNCSILDAAWGEFGRQLEYKLQWRGGELVRVNPAHTSQRCSGCGHVDADNRRSQAVFRCVACGHAENADVNAAKNILAAGLAVWAQREAAPQACGEDVRREAAAKRRRAASVKQEPSEGLVYT